MCPEPRPTEGGVPSIEELLLGVARGDAAAAERLLPLVYEELKRMASRELRAEVPDPLVQTTALAHDAWLKLAGPGSSGWRDRAHFLAVAAEAMRRLLVDHARRRGAAKRGGGHGRLELVEELAQVSGGTAEAVDFEDALQRFAGAEPRAARVVHLRVYGGLTVEEVARVLSVSPRTVKGDLGKAREWLSAALGSASSGTG